MQLKTILLPFFAIAIISCENNEIESQANNTSASTKIEVDYMNEALDKAFDELYAQKAADKLSEELVTDDVIKYVANIDHKEMVDQGGYDETSTIVRYFKPAAFDIEVAYVQIVYTKGEVREPSYLFFYPDYDDDGNQKLSSDVYSLQKSEDYPCYICDLDAISVDSNGEIPGEFIDHNTKERFVKYMDFNFVEMWMSWTDKPYSE